MQWKRRETKKSANRCKRHEPAEGDTGNAAQQKVIASNALKKWSFFGADDVYD